jgi:transcriptional regulator with XRE-family HTH domain
MYETMKSIPTQINELVRKSGLTQVAIAAILGITPQRLNNYKQGIRPIRAEHFERLKLIAGRGDNPE